MTNDPRSVSIEYPLGDDVETLLMYEPGYKYTPDEESERERAKFMLKLALRQYGREQLRKWINHTAKAFYDDLYADATDDERPTEDEIGGRIFDMLGEVEAWNEGEPIE